ncbi:MAG: hypothetical protein ACFCAD_25620 [Pleurocapsa sp.]
MKENKSSQKTWFIAPKTLIYLSRGILGLVFPISVLARLFYPQIVAAANFPDEAQAWLNTMTATGYLQTLLYATEFLTGIAILAGVFVPLALTALAPIIFNIALFHFFLDSRPERLLLVLLIATAYLILAYHHRAAFEPLFNRVEPTRFPLIKGFSLCFGIQIMMSLVFIVAGAAKLIIPEQLNVGNLLIDGMKATGYLYTLLGITEVIAGLALLSDRKYSIPVLEKAIVVTIAWTLPDII